MITQRLRKVTLSDSLNNWRTDYANELALAQTKTQQNLFTSAISHYQSALQLATKHKHKESTIEAEHLLKVTLRLYQNSLKLTYPVTIKKLFQQLSIPNCQHYMTGVALIHLLTGFAHDTVIFHTLDFVNNCPSKSLHNLGCCQSFNTRNMHTACKQNLNINTYTILNDMHLRDMIPDCAFTVSTLCGDKDGSIYDPSGMAIQDYATRTLRMINDPKIHIAKNPLILLRVVKYGLYGFKPDMDLQQAIDAWQPDPNLNLRDFCASIRRSLNIFDLKEYVEQWQKLGLFNKLFATDAKATTAECTALLQGLLNNQLQLNYYHQGQLLMFSAETDEEQDLLSKLISNPRDALLYKNLRKSNVKSINGIPTNDDDPKTSR